MEHILLYEDFSRGIVRSSEEQAEDLRVIKDMESLGYEFSYSEDDKEDRFRPDTLFFKKDGRTWRYLQLHRLYFPVPYANKIGAMYIEVSPKDLKSMMGKIDQSFNIIDSIQKFLEIIGRQPGRLNLYEVDRKSLNIDITFSRDEEQYLRRCRIRTPDPTKIEIKRREDEAGIFTGNFQTKYDSFFISLMNFAKIEYPLVKNIVDKYAKEPLGTCLSFLEHELRGKLTKKKFGF